jgi:pimeloyl-ACP methyl ester carboxylesterase
MFERCAERTTCVLYDRAGSGWSDPASSPRGADEITSDLHTVLCLADVHSPLVLVGHSYGGLLVRAFAQRFPNEVAGLVLVDPQTEGIPLPDPNAEGIAQAMIDELRRNPEIMREWYPALFAEWEKFPPGVGQPLMARHMNPDFAMAGLRDIADAHLVQQDVGSGSVLPDIPVIILTGMAIDRGPGLSEAEQGSFNAIKLEAHAALAASMPQAEHRVLHDAGHLLFIQQPDVVVEAVFAVLDRYQRRH